MRRSDGCDALNPFIDRHFASMATGASVTLLGFAALKVFS